MNDLDHIAQLIAVHRKRSRLTQHELASRAGVSRLLIAKLETGRYPEIGFTRLLRILHVLGLDLRITALNLSRPTLEDLQAENLNGEVS